jgi:O-antigen/teichoic acid export membrane protein
LGLKDAGIYGRNMFFGILVAIPYRAIHKVSSGVISNSFKENNMENIKMVYYKSSLNQTIMGIFILCGIWLNIHNVYKIIPSSYETGKYVILFVGIGNLFTMIGGVNTAVISFSPYYRWNTIFVALLLTLVVVTNIIFIPIWNITGAAFAIAVSLFLYNLMMYILLFVKYKFQPINYRHFLIMIVAAGSFIAAYIIPVIKGSFILDILVRSTIFALLFGMIVYFTKLSTDINNMTAEVLKRFKK